MTLEENNLNDILALGAQLVKVTPPCIGIKN